jgi:hypothetical protein
MKEPINLLVNGASFSRGPTAWPYHLDGVNLTNLACAAAGNTYIHDTTISELANRKYDFVAIMWTEPARTDIKVSNINVFNTSTYTSKYQSTKNDWQGKIIYPVNDQDYVEKNWVFGCGYINKESELLKTKLFDQLYRYQSIEQLVEKSLIHMISLQGILKSINIPYLFMYDNDYSGDFQKFSALYNVLDQANIYITNNIYAITKQNNWYDEDKHHPGPEAHKKWAELINPFITK